MGVSFDLHRRNARACGRALATALPLAALAGCGTETPQESSAAQPPPPASVSSPGSEPTAPAEPVLTYIVSETCRGDLARIDANAADSLNAFRRVDARRASLEEQAERAKARATELGAEADALADAAAAIESEYDAVVNEYNALVRAYPAGLPEPQYAQALNLEARAVELEAEHSAAVNEYNAAADRANAATDEANQLVNRHNAAVRQTNRLARIANRRERRYGATLDDCLDETEGSGWAQLVEPLEVELLQAASTLTAVERVECHPFSDWQRLERREADPEHVLDGYVFEGETVIHLAPRVCYALAERLLDPGGQEGCYRASNRADLAICPPAAALLASSIETLAHEAMHAKGIEREARATCYGIQEAVGLAETAFGLGREDARAMARYEITFVGRPATYRSNQCRRGGALDLAPETLAWP